LIAYTKVIRTELSTTTAGIRNVVLQVGQRIGHGHAALPQGFFEFVWAKPGDFRRFSRRQLSFPIQGDGKFQMQVRLSLLPLGLEALREIQGLSAFSISASRRAVAPSQRVSFSPWLEVRMGGGFGAGPPGCVIFTHPPHVH